MKKHQYLKLYAAIDDLKIGTTVESVQPVIKKYDFETENFGEFSSTSVGTTVTQISDAAKNGALGMRATSISGSKGHLTSQSFGPSQTIYIGMWIRLHEDFVEPVEGWPYTSIFRTIGGTSSRPDGWFRFYTTDGFMSHMWHNHVGSIKVGPIPPLGQWYHVVFATKHAFGGANGYRTLYINGEIAGESQNVNNAQDNVLNAINFGPIFTSGALTMTYDIDDIKIGNSFDAVRPE